MKNLSSNLKKFDAIATMTTDHKFTLIRRFDTVEAEELARIGGIRHDLNRVLEYCSVLEALSPAPITMEPLQPLLVWETVSTACVITYARCFASGFRRPLEHTLLDTAPEHLRNAHTYFFEIRNKHVAHSVNSSEDNAVMLEFGMKGMMPQSVISATTRSHRLIPIGESEISMLRELVSWIEGQVELQYVVELDKVLHAARKLSPDELLDLGSAPRRSFFQHDKSLTRRREKQ